MKIRELISGMRFKMPWGGSSVYVSQSAHPLYRGLQLVVWIDEEGRVMLDALDAEQDIGDPRPDWPEGWQQNVKLAFDQWRRNA